MGTWCRLAPLSSRCPLLLLLLLQLKIRRAAAAATSGHDAPGCGHNAVRHRQDAQLRKLLGDEWTPTGGRRRLAAADAGPPTRLQRLLAGSKAAPMRVLPVYQLEAGYLNDAQTSKLRKQLVPGAIAVLSQYVQVRLYALVPAHYTTPAFGRHQKQQIN